MELCKFAMSYVKKTLLAALVRTCRQQPCDGQGKHRKRLELAGPGVLVQKLHFVRASRLYDARAGLSMPASYRRLLYVCVVFVFHQCVVFLSFSDVN